MENRESLINKFSKIGYKISGTFPNCWIHNNKGKNTGFCVLSERIDYRGDHFNMCMDYKHIEIYLLDGDNTLVIRDINNDTNTGFFIMFHKKH